MGYSIDHRPPVTTCLLVDDPGESSEIEAGTGAGSDFCAESEDVEGDRDDPGGVTAAESPPPIDISDETSGCKQRYRELRQC